MLLVGVAVLMVSARAQTEEGALADSGQGIIFDIPAMDLGQAIRRYSESTGITVLVDTDLIRDRESAPLSGNHPPKKALRILLGSNGLDVLYLSDNAFTLVEGRAAAPAPSEQVRLWAGVSRPGLGGHRYAAVLQHALERRLCTDKRTRPGGYRAALQFWIGPEGQVNEARLLGTTGNSGRDRALLAVIRGLRIQPGLAERPPQPLTILILPSDKPGSHCPPAP